MSETELYGKEGLEHDAGYQTLIDPYAEPKSDTFGSDLTELRKAARETDERRQQPAQEPIERRYNGEDGKPLPRWNDAVDEDGKNVPQKTIQGAERGARDLAERRGLETGAQELEEHIELAAAIDQRRLQAAQELGLTPPQSEQQQDATAQPTEVTPQPQEAPHQKYHADPEVDAAFQNTKVRAAVLESLTAQQAQHTQQLTQNATVAAATLFAQFPELAGINDVTQLQTAIGVLAQSNPPRAQQAIAHVQAVAHLAGEAQAAQLHQMQASVQQTAQQMKVWDDQFEASAVQQHGKETYAAIQKEIPTVAKQYGLSEKDLYQAWKTEPILHHPAFQQMVMDAARFQMMKRSAAQPAKRPAPQVVRPGTSDYGAVDHSGVDAKAKAFLQQPDARTAAKLLIARRAAANSR